MDWDLLGHFLHGLVFFTLALAVAFLSYRSHRILLARRLSWLGVFAACEAIFAWRSFFTEVIGRDMSLALSSLWVACLALGYVFLLGFGIQAFRTQAFTTSESWRLLIGLHGLWLVPCAFRLAAADLSWESMTPYAETVLRYVVAFPASTITALGLRKQSHKSLDSVLHRKIRPYLRLSDIALVLLAALNLVLAPLAPLWRWIHIGPSATPSAFFEWLWILGGIALMWGWGGSLTVIQRDIEHWVEGVERLQTLAADRERIGRDLHDGIIQSIYAAGLLLESIIPVIPQDPERAQSQVGRVLDSLNHTIQDIRRYIFDLRSDIADEDVLTGIEHLLRDFRVNTLLETEMEIIGTPAEIASIERRRHIFQIVREALANTARHARARWVKVQLRYNEDSLDLVISDDGIGMETLLIGKGYGLRNIRERARLLDGVLRIESAPGEGVTFHLTVPY